jgi:multidrug efflux pump subunit AcrA (membrane-fusion protein)
MLLAMPLAADDIYRSVDAQGNVTFTDQPPTGNQQAEKVELPPGPSPASIRDTEQRIQAIDQAVSDAQRQRLSQEKQKDHRVEAARKALEAAEEKLAQAKVIKEEDRQNLAGGKRRINPEYFARVKDAKAEVDKARKALREARGY